MTDPSPPPDAGRIDPSGREQQMNWLIYDTRSECFWGPNRGGYWKSIVDAGLYTEAEAKEAEDFARRYDRGEVARPLEQYRAEIERLAAALGIPTGDQLTLLRQTVERQQQEIAKAKEAVGTNAETFSPYIDALRNSKLPTAGEDR